MNTTATANATPAISVLYFTPVRKVHNVSVGYIYMVYSPIAVVTGPYTMWGPSPATVTADNRNQKVVISSRDSIVAMTSTSNVLAITILSAFIIETLYPVITPF